MSTLGNVRKIVSEDFPEEARPVIDKLAFILNKHMQDVTIVVNGSIDFANLAFEKVSFDLTVDATGTPTDVDVIQTNLNDVSGILCIRAVPQDDTANYATGTPFINYEYTDNRNIKILNVTGLIPDEQYVVTVVLF